MESNNEKRAAVARWAAIAALVIWLTCLPLLLPSPWHWADDAERIAEHTAALESELAKRQGRPVSDGAKADNVASARRLAWIEWLWLAVTVLAGVAIAALRPRRFWTAAILSVVAVYLLSRWSFASVSYQQLFRAAFDESARSGQAYLLRTSPFEFGQLLYYNIVVPLLLITVAIAGKARRDRTG